MHIYMVCPSQLQSFMKFCWAVSEELHNWRTDWLTDRRVKTIIPFTTRCVGYKKAAKPHKEKFISEHISKDNVYLTNYNS